MAFELLRGAEVLILHESNMYKLSRQADGPRGQRCSRENARKAAIILIVFKADAGIRICHPVLNAVLAEKFNTNCDLHT
jgi:hypothetical protein